MNKHITDFLIQLQTVQTHRWLTDWQNKIREIYSLEACFSSTYMVVPFCFFNLDSLSLSNKSGTPDFLKLKTRFDAV